MTERLPIRKVTAGESQLLRRSGAIEGDEIRTAFTTWPDQGRDGDRAVQMQIGSESAIRRR